MTNNRVSEAASDAPERPAPRRSAPWLNWLLLAAIVLLGAYFSTINLFGWDNETGQHPDERFMTYWVAGRMKMPTSLDQYIDSSRNPLNPRNNGNAFYVYGLLPPMLTHITAVALTPDEALPTIAVPADPVSYGHLAPVPNPDLNMPKLRPLQQLLNPTGLDLTSAPQVQRVGRAWSAIFQLLSVVVVFLIGRRLYGARVGLLAALLLALAAFPIQQAHFFTVDTATEFFTLLSVYWAVRCAQNGGWPSFAALGISIGATMACRVTMASLGLLAVLAVALRFWATPEDASEQSDASGHLAPAPLGFVRGIALLALAGVVTIVSFRMLQPDAFVGTSFFDLRPEPRFVKNIVEIGAQVNGQIDSPPSQQWAGRVPYLFPLRNMIVWGMGLPLGLAAWLGWAVAGFLMARAAWAGWTGGGWSALRRRLVHLLPWTWIAFYFAWQGGILGMTMRYYLMLYGLLALFAAWGLTALWDRRPTKDQRPKTKDQSLTARLRRWFLVPGPWSLILVVAGTLCWAYAFTRIYTRPHSRVEASRWMYEHVPAGSKVTSEQWDDALPLSVDGRSAFKDAGFPDGPGFYFNIQTYPYAEDDQTKYIGSIGQDGRPVPGLLEQLDNADYIVLSSNRVYDSATRMPARYPALTRYYHYLFSGELGFELVADIGSYPTLFGIPIPDQAAEEAFSVYDHPRVLIFKKTDAYSKANADRLITGDVAWDEVYKLSTLKSSKVPTALRLTADQWPVFRAAGTWAALFDPASLANQAPWLFWLLALELLGLSAFALLFRLLPPGLPDRGFALAKMLGLLAVAYCAWVLGSLRALVFGPVSVWLCAGALIVAGGLAGWRRRAEIAAFARRRRAALLTAEGLFLAAYFGFLLVRALNPDLWHPARGGEKPMDLAFLTAVIKSPSFPPYDPWFAGGYINYYYFGFVIVGALVHMTGIVPATAYNLAVPTLFALTALGAWGVAYNLVALPTTDDRRPTTVGVPSRATNGRWSVVGSRLERRAIVTGLVAAAFVVLLGPLTQAIWLLPGTADRVDPGIPAECRQVSSYAAQQICRGRAEWAFWDATRLIGMDLKDSTITEFPFFTFLFADLHAHMIALPLALAALGLMVALVRRTTNDERRTALVVGRWSLVVGRSSLVLLALVVGALRATNTWDYPTYLGLSVLVLALVAWREWRRGLPMPRTALLWIGSSLGVVLGSIVLFLPFTRWFATDYAGFTLWSGSRTPVADILKIDGLWLFMLGCGALLLYHRRGWSPARLASLAGAALLLALATVTLRTSALALMLPVAGAAIYLLIDFLLGAGRPATMAGPPATAEWPRLREPYVQLTLPMFELDSLDDRPYFTGHASADASRPPAGLTTLLPLVWAVAGLLIVVGTEIVVARGDIGRMNTVFKFGMQSWVLLAIPSALACTALWQATGARTTATSSIGWAWRGAAALLIAAALVYPLTSTPARLKDRIDPAIGPTLDGLAFMASPRASWNENSQGFTLAEDARAMDWLRSNVAGTPIVLEAQTEAYRWGGRVSIYTGLPTLLGWPGHESQQRSVAEVAPVLARREALVQRLYTGGDQSEVLRMLKLYGVEYVYVGQLERALYNSAGLATFDALARDGQLQQVYADGATRIYQVPRGEADPAPALLTTSLPVRAPALPPAQDTRLTAPVGTLPALDEYAWNGLAAAQPVAVLLWLLACYALLALGLPVAVLVFGRRAGAGGSAWARLIGLLLLGYAVWMPVSMGLWHYNRWGLLWGVLLVLALDAAIVARLGRPATKDQRPLWTEGLGAWGLGWRAAGKSQAPSLKAHESFVVRRSSFVRGLGVIRDDLLAHRRAALAAELLFLGGFAVMAVIRALNPDLWQPIFGGEKPFEFGFLNAILRSPVMPPYDPFFSDGTINYYYYGLFLVSLPVKATGIPPAVAFNLIVPTLFALTLVGAFAIVARLTGRIGAGLAGASFVALIGNLAAAFPVGLSRGLQPVREALAPGLAGFGQRLGDWFWGPSRVIHTTYQPGDPLKIITINEFPLWSYLFADLHPHLIAMPIALLVIALAFELLDDRPRTKDQRPKTKDQGPRTKLEGSREAGWHSSFVFRLSSFVLAALALGALAVTNSWDFPTYLLVVAGALLGRAWLGRRRTGRSRWIGLGWSLASVGALGLAAVLLYLPFFQSYVTPAGVRGIGLVRDGSPLGGYLLIYGLFLAILAPWVAAAAGRIARGRLRPARLAGSAIAEEPAESTAVLGIVARPPSPAGAWRTLRTALLAGSIVLGLLIVAGVAQPQLRAALWSSPLLLKALLLALLVAGAIVLLERRLPRAAWFIAWLAVAAWAVSLGVELIYIRDHLDGGDAYRMNTVFKFGLQAWILLALAAAAALPWLARLLRRLGPVAQGVGWAIFATLLALALVFPLAGIPSRVAYRFPEAPGPTLDGLAFMELASYSPPPEYLGLAKDGPPIQISLRDDWEAIRWLDRNISGTPIVLQSSYEFYRAYGVRIAANTGLPMVVSPLHASEQHDPQEVNQRDLDVQQIYRTTDSVEALRLLSKYHVGYVYVGQIERAAYGEAGVAKFAQLANKSLGAAGSYLDVVYRSGSVTIYQVRDEVYAVTPTSVPAVPPFIAQQQGQDAPPQAPAEQPANQATIEELEQRVKDDPSAGGPAFELAQRYMQQNRLEDAAAVLAPAARAHPQDVALHHLWGDVLSQLGRLDEAESAYRDAIAADPSSGNYNKLGMGLLKWGRLDKAAEAFQQAIDADANAAEPHVHLGQVYEQQGLTDQALEQYRAYLTIAGPEDQFSADATEALKRLGGR